MRCIIGLGNPEPRYAQTRHNVGFQIADRLAGVRNAGFTKGRGDYLSSVCTIAGNDILIVKPTTYMNRSGIAVRHVLRYYRIPGEDAVIVLDDLDLPFGTFRLRPRGGDAGNLGLRSIIRETGTEEIARFRFGIRNRQTIANPRSYVLSQFTRTEKKKLPGLLERAEEALITWIDEGITRAMDRFNRNHLEDRQEGIS